MTAAIYPFPLTRRVDFLRRHSAIVANLPADAGRRHIAQQTKIQRDALMRRGIDQDIIDRELRALEAVLRSAAMERVA